MAGHPIPARSGRKAHLKQSDHGGISSALLCKRLCSIAVQSRTLKVMEGEECGFGHLGEQDYAVPRMRGGRFTFASPQSSCSKHDTLSFIVIALANQRREQCLVAHEWHFVNEWPTRIADHVRTLRYFPKEQSDSCQPRGREG